MWRQDFSVFSLSLCRDPVCYVATRDGKLTGKFRYPPRLAPFGTGMEILYSGMGRVWVPSQKPDSGLGRVWDFSYPPRPEYEITNIPLLYFKLVVIPFIYIYIYIYIP